MPGTGWPVAMRGRGRIGASVRPSISAQDLGRGQRLALEQRLGQAAQGRLVALEQLLGGPRTGLVTTEWIAWSICCAVDSE
jgi:hypothetical protein